MCDKAEAFSRDCQECVSPVYPGSIAHCIWMQTAFWLANCFDQLHYLCYLQGFDMEIVSLFADVTVGGWMLAMNVTHLDDRRLCERECGDATLAVYDIPECAGLCDAPQKLPELHRDPKCRTPILDSKGDIPTLRPFFYFQSVRPK